MVTIVNDNRPRYRTICNNCGIELEYCDSDIKKKYRSGGDGWAYHYEYYEYLICCPVCNNETSVEDPNKIKDDGRPYLGLF